MSRTEHILGQKTSPNKFKSIEIISGIFSDHNGMNLGINQPQEQKKWEEKKNTHTLTWRLKTTTKKPMGQQRNQRRN